MIVIDDFKVPNQSQFVYYAQTLNGKTVECSYESIKENLDKTFTEYTIGIYLLPKKPDCCANFVSDTQKI